MIVRVWRCSTAARRADDYVRFLDETRVADMTRIEGNRGVLVLRRAEARSAEFLIVSFWDSVAAITALTGEDISRPVLYADEERYLEDKDDVARHYEGFARGELALAFALSFEP